ncbi:hypothetical protein ACFL5X_02800 [Candidatus Omnitrophota bacterium]
MHKIYRGYNYYDLGKIICRRFDDPERWVEAVKAIKNADDRRYCYAGMGWGFGKEKFDSDYDFYLSKVVGRIDKEYLPYVYDRLGGVMGMAGHSGILSRDLKRRLRGDYSSYFYQGLGREAGRRFVCEIEGYKRLRDRVAEEYEIDAEYQTYFHEGIGVELYEVLVNDSGRFMEFMKTVDEGFRLSVYEGLAGGREYYQFDYGEFGSGIGKAGYSMDRWKRIIDKIEKEYRPFCYRRLGIEMGWRFIHDIKRYLVFLDMVDAEYRQGLYRGLGIGIGWRFGHDIDSCVQLISQTDQYLWPYIYEGLGLGVSRKYAYQSDEWAKEAEKVPAEYEAFFEAGVRKARQETQALSIDIL